MTDDDKKLLTEFLGEHRYVYTSHTKPSLFHTDRSFTTWQDLGDIRVKLVEKERYDDFLDFTYRKIAREIDRVRHSVRGQQVSEIDGPIEIQWSKWLFNPPVFIPLVVEFLRKEKV